MLRVVSSLKNNSALISTAMLSAIFEENKQDNVALLVPFIIKIIYDDSSVSEKEIVEKMQNVYSFNNFPHAIAKIIINRLKKQQIIKQENGKYIFITDVSKIVQEFNDRLEKSKKEIEEIIHGLTDYFKKNTNLKLSYLECRNSFAKFLDQNGYLLYEDMGNSTRINKNIDNITYHIGRFINEHIEKQDIIYSYLVNIIEGSLIANALYVNIDNQNNTDLKKLTCFFDTPFMLKVLELKLPDENKSALELVDLLKELNVKIKCFRHNYNEIEYILEDYLKNYGKPQEKTLENLILKNYSESDVRHLLNSLDTVFANIGIEIVDIPDYDEKKYKHIIDEKQLNKNLFNSYKNKQINPKTIENDVKSVSAIMRLRDGKEYRKLEDCNAIFVTTNKDIRNETNKLLNLDVNFKISPVVSDMDLTAIVWLKSMINNKHLPEMKLTENAMAAIKPSSALRKKFHQSLSNLKTSKTDVTPETLYNLLCSNYYVEDLMINVNGDIKKINPGVLINTYEETLKKNSLLTEQDNKLSKENEELINQLLRKEEDDKKYRKNIYNKYAKREQLVINIIKVIEKSLKIVVCLFLFYLSYNQSNKPSPSVIVGGIYIILGIYTLLCNFIPISVFQIFEYLFNKINGNVFIAVNKHYTKVCEKEISTIFKIE